MSKRYDDLRFWYLHELRRLRASHRAGFHVRGEYIQTQKELAKLRKDRTMTSPTTATNAGAPKAATAPGNSPKASTPKTPKAPKVAAPKTCAGYQLTAVITLLKDKEGKQYSAENNPKRANSGAHKLFMKYREGMTVDAFVKAGGRASAIKYDVDHGYISVK